MGIMDILMGIIVILIGIRVILMGIMAILVGIMVILMGIMAKASNHPRPVKHNLTGQAVTLVKVLPER